MDIDDYDMGQDDERGPDAPRRPPFPWGLLVVGLLLVGGIGFGAYKLLSRSAPAPTPTPRAETLPAAPPASPSAEPATDLPALDESDGLVRELAKALSGDARWLEWLKASGLVRRLVVVVENIAQGQNPAQHLPFLGPKDSFKPVVTRGRVSLGAAGYARFDGFADTVASIDPERAAQMYRQLKPLITVAYRQLGHPEGGFDAALERAVVVLLRAPVLEGEVPLVYQPPFYRYADVTLEGLQPAQKQLIRMGAHNERKVQDKLREVARAIGIPDERLR
jgi:hypothetical protein